jgi:hypothetical protein
MSSCLPPTRMLIQLACKHTIPYLHFSRLPEDEPPGSKHVKGSVKIKILVQGASCWFILYDYITIRGAKT